MDRRGQAVEKENSRQVTAQVVRRVLSQTGAGDEQDRIDQSDWAARA